jgi:hypothetical protein
MTTARCTTCNIEVCGMRPFILHVINVCQAKNMPEPKISEEVRNVLNIVFDISSECCISEIQHYDTPKEAKARSLAN